MKKYYTAKEVAEVLGIHVNKVYIRLKEMRGHIGYGKEYPPTAALMDDQTYRVDLEAYMDFCNRRAAITTEK